MTDRVSHQQVPARARHLLRLVAALAAALGLAGTVALVVHLLTTPGRSVVTVQDMTLSNAEVPAFTRDLPGLQARYSSVDLTITEPPRTLVWLDVAQQAATSAGFIVVCALLVWLCLRTLKGRPFVATAPWVLVASGLTVLASSLLHDVLTGRVEGAVVQLYGPDSTGGDAGAGPYEGFGVATEVLLGNLGLAVALCVLGAVFALGTRLQQDTERLV